MAGPSCSLLVSADWTPPLPWPRATLASLAGHIKMSSVGFPRTARDALAPRGWLSFSREEGTQGYQRSPWDLSPPPESTFLSFSLGLHRLPIRWAFSSFPVFPEICPWEMKAKQEGSVPGKSILPQSLSPLGFAQPLPPGVLLAGEAQWLWAGPAEDASRIHSLDPVPGRRH